MLTPPSIERTLAARVRSARRDVEVDGRRLSQQAFADRVGVHVITVSAWERGKATPSVENLTRIARETGRPIAYFIGDEDDEEDDQAMLGVIFQLLDRGQYDLAAILLDRLRLTQARREERRDSMTADLMRVVADVKHIGVPA